MDRIAAHAPERGATAEEDGLKQQKAPETVPPILLRVHGSVDYRAQRHAEDETE